MIIKQFINANIANIKMEEMKRLQGGVE